MVDAKKTKGAARKGRSRKEIVISPEFVGMKIDGKVVVDDTAYFRHQAKLESIRQAWRKATRRAHARLAKLVEHADAKRPEQERMLFKYELRSALHRLETETVEHIDRVEYEATKRGRRNVKHA